MICPKCGHELGVETGGLSLRSGEISPERNNEEKKETPKKAVRGKAREYTQAFESAWKEYGRKDQKFEAFAIWLIRAREVGGEAKLLTLFLGAIKWQGPLWLVEGWKFAPYFERYLKRRKWEDEPPPLPRAAPRATDNRAAEATARKIAEINSYADKRPSAEELASLRAGRSG